MRYPVHDYYGNGLKCQLILSGLMAVFMAVVLGLSSAKAFVGEAVGGDLNQVTCTNTTTGATAPGDILPGGVYDCETVPTQSGDLVEVTLSGTALTGNPNCLDVMENAASPPVIPLTEGTCFNLMGSITAGFGDINNPTPGFEVDGFVLQATSVTGVRLSLVGYEGVQFISLIIDPNQNVLLTCILTPESCRGDIIVELSAIGVSASAAGSYALELRVVAIGSGSLPLSQSMTSSDHVTAAVEEAVRRYIGR